MFFVSFVKYNLHYRVTTEKKTLNFLKSFTSKYNLLEKVPKTKLRIEIYSNKMYATGSNKFKNEI